MHRLSNLIGNQNGVEQQLMILEETLQKIGEFVASQEEQAQMLTEDITATSLLKQQLVCQREELETFDQQVKSQFKQWSPQL